jgi:hypothetical protein
VAFKAVAFASSARAARVTAHAAEITPTALNVTAHHFRFIAHHLGAIFVEEGPKILDMVMESTTFTNINDVYMYILLHYMFNNIK